MDRIERYFSTYNEETARQALLQKNPPSPIYTLPEGRSWTLVTLDTIFTGVNLVFIYSFASFCFGKISGKTLPLLPSYIWKILPVCALPYVYRTLQSLIIPLFIHPISHPLFLANGLLEQSRVNLVNGGRQLMRFSVRAKGNTIDGVILKDPNANLDSRWIVISGDKILYEYDTLQFHKLANHLNANIISYNYPGSGRSSGLLLSKEVMIAAHRAILGFLEEELGAKEIIDLDHSSRSGVMGQDHLERPRTKAGTKYVLIFNETFTEIEDLEEYYLGKIGEWITKAFSWKYNNLEAVNQCKHGVIVWQRCPEDCREAQRKLYAKHIKVILTTFGNHAFPSESEMRSVIKEVDILFNSQKNLNIKAADYRNSSDAT